MRVQNISPSAYFFRLNIVWHDNVHNNDDEERKRERRDEKKYKKIKRHVCTMKSILCMGVLRPFMAMNRMYSRAARACDCVCKLVVLRLFSSFEIHVFSVAGNVELYS